MLSASRLVTLTGPGGVGKTRLAVRVGATLERAFADGVWLVELADMEKPELLIPTVIETLELRDQSTRPPMDVLTEYLADKRALMILDNCEHLLQECAVLAEALLLAAPDLRILATSRHVLGVAGEQAFPVPTLALSEPGTDAAASEAVQLFTERARAVMPRFSVTDENRTAVESICRRLDGLPLGIELAAVRLRALSVHQVLDRLDDRFRLLTTGSPAALPRHQTLRALIDWSHTLCNDEERTLWARVSVFSGGLDLEAAEAVCAGGDISADEVADLISGLVDKSILVCEEDPTAVRYRLLETIRQYGRERLAASGEAEQVLRRHRDYYRNLASEARDRLFGPDQVRWLTRLQREHANLRAALEFCFTRPGEAAAGLAMAADLLYHWITSSYLAEGRRWLDRGLAADTGRTEVRARALWADSWLAIIQADVDAATAMLQESEAIGEELGLESVLGYVAVYAGMIAMWRRDVTAAIALYEAAAARHRAAGDPVGLALALIRLSLAYSFLGDSARAIAFGEEGIAVCETYGEGWHRAYAMMALGIEIWRQGDARRAAAMEQESLRFNRSLDDALGIGMNLEVLAWIAAGEEQFTRAARLLGAVQNVWKSVGAPLSGYGHLVHFHDECEARTRQALGASAFSSAFQHGARLSHEAALSYALEERPAEAAAASGAAEASPLTPRETEIAGLVAQGLSNKDIAATLVIAQRTVEGHIEHIMDKLGFRSRARIASWVRERDGASGNGGPSG
ncbi:LuxR family transcriptional regulator [Actinomadura rubrobrunea]|uniref:LuxR family transcriptional regulator n=1 Tax=Actinomadura rubrobrunea TaxID=115335 RepID=A0A9W6UXB2_9ACTN|nr:LuxR C-terminal-related transcriptional regulator [Actinomadura rubrobrunea]GLW67144.1 LuxR family transcriptional regulator [Actinomadura rubrobrunea]